MMSEPNQTTIDHECELDNAAERDRVRVWWEDRALVLAWLALLGMVVVCEVMRGF